MKELPLRAAPVVSTARGMAAGAASAATSAAPTMPTSAAYVAEAGADSTCSMANGVTAGVSAGVTATPAGVYGLGLPTPASSTPKSCVDAWACAAASVS